MFFKPNTIRVEFKHEEGVPLHVQFYKRELLDSNEPLVLLAMLLLNEHEELLNRTKFVKFDKLILPASWIINRQYHLIAKLVQENIKQEEYSWALTWALKNVNGYRKQLQKLIAKQIAFSSQQLLVQDIIGVQPMTGPVGEIYSLHTTYLDRVFEKEDINDDAKTT
jgi:hypothetical protein